MAQVWRRISGHFRDSGRRAIQLFFMIAEDPEYLAIITSFFGILLFFKALLFFHALSSFNNCVKLVFLFIVSVESFSLFENEECTLRMPTGIKLLSILLFIRIIFMGCQFDSS